jgi:hypothetical protein
MSDASKPRSRRARNAHTKSDAPDTAREELMRFNIGLRLLGEEKRQRYFAYIASLLESEAGEKRE